MKRFFVIFPVILVAAALLAMLAFSGRDSSGNEAAPTARVTIANIGPYSVYNLIAHERGFFREQGLEATIVEYDSGATSIGALLDGRADIAVAADFVGVVNMAERPDIRIIAQVSNHEVFSVIGRRDRGITAPADLKGKTIGLTRRTAGEYYLDRFLLFNGIGEDEVKKADLSPSAMAAGIVDGTLDAILIFEPHVYALEQELGDAAVVWSAQRGRDTQALVYSTREFVERHPEIVEKYLRAIVTADRSLKRDERGGRDIIARALRYDPVYEEYIWKRFEFFVGLRQEMLLRLEDQARFLRASGQAAPGPVPDYLGYIHFDGLEAVDPGAVSIIHR